MRVAFFVLTIPFFFFACATASVKKWEGRRITLCCPAVGCNEESWQETLGKHCRGKAKAISGSTTEKVTGVMLHNSGTYGTGFYREHGQAHAITQETNCRTFECPNDLEGL